MVLIMSFLSGKKRKAIPQKGVWPKALTRGLK
jgi:hypothetical protein